jgi:Bacterial PH domain
VRRSRGGDAALWVAVGLLFLAVAALVLGGSRQPGMAMLWLCIGAAALAAAGTFLLIWGIGYQRLTYALTENALRIDWLGRTMVLPYPAIQGIYTGQRLSGHSTPSMPRWPGISVGSARVRGFGRLRFFATSSDQSQLTYITVEHGGVILSARDPNAFRAGLIERVERYDALPSKDALAWHQAPPTTAPWTAFADVWLPVCMALGLLGLLAVLAVVTSRFDALPDQIAVHFDASNRPNQIAAKSDLLRLTLFGLLCLMLNWVAGILVHPREQLLARLLWLGAAVVQFVLLLGVLRIVG